MTHSHTDIGITEKVTYFAEPHRSDILDLYKDIDEISVSTVLNEILKTVPNFLLILNNSRQIITVNYAFMNYLGIENASELLGLRLGEALKCDYSNIMPAGCGTSKYCNSCGAAISIVSALENNNNNEQYCSILSTENGITKEYFLSVKSSRIILNKKKYLLVFLEDLTEHQKRTYLEKTFFGDISNLINILNNDISYINNHPEDLEAQCSNVKQIAKLINNEVEYQKILFKPEDLVFHPEKEQISLTQLLTGIKKIFENNPIAVNVLFSVVEPNEDTVFISDSVLITRILMHMLTNAFEHGKPNSVVRIWSGISENEITFKCWNDYYIPEEIAVRIFQKYFTTYPDIGRGMGTYFMKYFGENILGGKVNFTTSKAYGTTFILTLPLNRPDFK